MRKIALPVLMVAIPAWAQGEPDPYLAQAKVLYQGLEYERCIQRLDQAEHWNNSRPELVDIEIYAALCQFALGNAKAAEDHFKVALALDPELSLPPLTSPKIQDFFHKIPKPPPRPPPAPEVPVTVPAGTGETWAPLPAAPSEATTVVTQPETPRPSLVVPLSLAGVGVALAGGGVTLGVLAQNAAAESNADFFAHDAAAAAARARTLALGANAAYAAALAALITASVVFLVTRH